MTALLTFLKLAWPYILAAGIGAAGMHEFDQIPYSRLQTTLASERTQRADELAAAQKAAADALQAQINTRLTTEATNGKVLSQLQSERDTAIAARDFSDRLLSAAAQAKPPGSHPVPAPGHQPTPDAASQPSGGGQLADLLTAAAAETSQCFEHYTGLQLQLAPQLMVPHVQ